MKKCDMEKKMCAREKLDDIPRQEIKDSDNKGNECAREKRNIISKQPIWTFLIAGVHSNVNYFLTN